MARDPSGWWEKDHHLFVNLYIFWVLALFSLRPDFLKKKCIHCIYIPVNVHFFKTMKATESLKPI